MPQPTSPRPPPATAREAPLNASVPRIQSENASGGARSSAVIQTVARSTVPAGPEDARTPRSRRCAPMEDRLNAVTQVERGQKTSIAICGEYGISMRTYYRWSAQVKQAKQKADGEDHGPEHERYETDHRSNAGAVDRYWRWRRDASSDEEEDIDMADLKGPNTRRIIVTDGKDKVPIVWYSGTEAEDIRKVVRKRFKLADARLVLLKDCWGDDVTVSASVPSGDYELVVV